MQSPSKPRPAPRRSLIAAIDDWLQQRRRRDVEAYLARSQNVFELETRMRALDRADLQPYY